jgi:hypothetical protein
MNANAAHGAHTAAANVDGVAAHVLFVKSPHRMKPGRRLGLQRSQLLVTFRQHP